MSNPDVYTERLLHFWDRALFGFTHDDYTHGASGTDPVCGDEVKFRLVIRDNRLEVVDVWARGCCVSECCAAMLAELARGKLLSWVNAFTDNDWLIYVAVPLNKSRLTSCVLPALHCLRKAISTLIYDDDDDDEEEEEEDDL